MSWLAVFICLVVSMMFSGIEAGVLSVSRVRLRHRVRMNDRAAIRLQRLLGRPERVLVTVLLVTNFMNICALILAAQECVRRFGFAGYPLAGVVALPLYLLGIELLPKSIFRRFPYRALAAFSEPLRLADLLLSPVLNAGAWLLRIFVRRKTQEEKKLFVAREDFKYFTIESEREGTLGKVEREMIHNIVDFRKIRAMDVMTPFAQVRVVGPDTPINQLLQISRDSQVERLPIVSEDGRVVGLVNVFEVLVDLTQREKVSAYQRRVVMVPPNEEAYQVMRKLRAARSSMAIVAEGDNRPVGAVTFETLMSRLVKMAEVKTNV